MVKIFDSILYLQLAHLVEIVAVDTVQHHVDKRPDWQKVKVWTTFVELQKVSSLKLQQL